MSASQQRQRPGWLSFLRELAIILIIAIVVTFVVRTWLVRAFFIPSPSMETTLEVDDQVLVNQLAGTITSIDRGDIIVFDDPGGWLDPAVVAAYEPNPILDAVGLIPDDAGSQLIKRVIAVGRDTVSCCDDEGRVVVNGEPLDEFYLDAGVAPSEIAFEVEVPADHYWVMGDNRGNSLDSRYNLESPGGAFVPKSDVIGTAFVRHWPLSRFTLLRNPQDVFIGVPDP